MRKTAMLSLLPLVVGCAAAATGRPDTMRTSSMVLGGETKHHVPVLVSAPEANTDAAPRETQVDLLGVTEKILVRADRLGFERLSRPEQNVAAVWALEGDVNHGGFDQYFFNPSGDLVANAPEALREIGAPAAAAIVEEAVSAFGSDGPAMDQEDRQRQLVRLAPTARKQWAALDQRFTAYADDITTLLKAYVNANREAFL